VQPNNAAGPGSVQENDVAPRPLLEGVSEYQVVTILNPLSVDFIGKVGQSKPVSLPFEVRKDGYTNPLTRTEEDVTRNYGLNLKNPDHQARIPISSNVHIPSGRTINLQGNEAKVIVTQLVNEILQREGKKLFLADPTTRVEVERRIVMSIRSLEDVLGTVQSVQTQINEGLNKVNEQDEPEFPGLAQTAPAESAGSGASGDAAGERPARTRGRPPKAQ
jgi:hypothetical protein